MFPLGSHVIGVEPDHPDNAGLACWLVGLPPLDGGNTLYDLTGRTAGATLAGGASWAATPYGQSGLSLNGSSGYAQLAMLQPQDFTLCATALPASLGYRALVGGSGAGGTVEWRTNPSGQQELLREGQALLATSATGVAAGVPRRLAVTYSAGAVAWYLDGRPDGSGSPGVQSWALSPLRVGNNYQTEYWAGGLSSVRIAAGAASPAQLARDFEWSQDPHRDPRFRRTSTRSLFGTAGGVPAVAFVPAFAPGWGW